MLGTAAKSNDPLVPKRRRDGAIASSWRKSGELARIMPELPQELWKLKSLVELVGIAAHPLVDTA